MHTQQINIHQGNGLRINASSGMQRWDARNVDFAFLNVQNAQICKVSYHFVRHCRWCSEKKEKAIKKKKGRKRWMERGGWFWRREGACKEKKGGDEVAGGQRWRMDFSQRDTSQGLWSWKAPLSFESRSGSKATGFRFDLLPRSRALYSRGNATSFFPTRRTYRVPRTRVHFLSPENIGFVAYRYFCIYETWSVRRLLSFDMFS